MCEAHYKNLQRSRILLEPQHQVNQLIASACNQAHGLMVVSVHRVE